MRTKITCLNPYKEIIYEVDEDIAKYINDSIDNVDFGNIQTIKLYNVIKREMSTTTKLRLLSLSPKNWSSIEVELID